MKPTPNPAPAGPVAAAPVRVTFLDTPCLVQQTAYTANSRTAILLIDEADGAPFATATTNAPDLPIADDEVIIKDYGENRGLLAVLVAAGIVAPTGRSVSLGFCQAPICRVLVALPPAH